MKNIIKNITISKKNYEYISFSTLEETYNINIHKLPISIKILLENVVRNSKETELQENINKFSKWLNNKDNNQEISYFPSRVLMQDFTGVPALVDLAAIRHAIKENGSNPEQINPLSPVDLVIDHSVQVDSFATDKSLNINTDLEFQRNMERYEFLKWGQKSFDNFRVIPPGVGICHQVNLEYLASVITNKNNMLFPDTVVGTDSHTTMINGLGVLGWGVGGIEAEAAMLGESISMVIPEVVGVKLTGQLSEGVTATDLVLTITETLRKFGAVGKFVEFYGEALQNLSVSNRSTIANMAPEYGATCGYFPIDEETLEYLDVTGRNREHISIVKEYMQIQGLNNNDNAEFNHYLEINLNDIQASIAGPKRPQDRINLSDASKKYQTEFNINHQNRKTSKIPNNKGTIKDGDIVIAAITSCTNTSNPNVMIAAGLLARNAVNKGLTINPNVKTSLAPGSQAVSGYLQESGLQDSLDQLGFNIVGYGCTTCIGNSGPLDEDLTKIIKENNINVASILSGNRNFEGRVHPLTKANYLASPPLVIAYALLGNIIEDITTEPLGTDNKGQNVYLKDIWPSNEEINNTIKKFISRKIFIEKYKNIFDGDQLWQNIEISSDKTYNWNPQNSYIKNPPYFDNLLKQNNSQINNANVLALFGDSITTDHISPAGVIAYHSPAAKYLKNIGIEQNNFNSYGSRRGNHEVMMRGTFANIRIKNELLNGEEGGNTIYWPTKEKMSIYDAAMKYKESNSNLVIIAGKEYGTGSSRDWAAKGTLLLGVKAVIAESFERIHRSNLIGMGVLPLIFKQNDNRHTLALKGNETITINNIDSITPGEDITCTIKYIDNTSKNILLTPCIKTVDEVINYNNGGILQAIVKKCINIL